MSTITKEFAQDIIRGHGYGVAPSAVEALARIALASLEEGTELQRKAAIHDALCEKYNVESLIDFVEWQRNHIAELEAAPPAPVGHGEAEVMPDYPGYVMTQRECFEAGKKAGMAELVTTAYKLPDDFDFDRFNDVVWLEAVASNPHMHSLTTSTIAMVALELNKRLEAGNAPVIPDGWVACSERMPEVGVKVLCFPVNDEPIHATYNGQVWLQDISWSTSDEPIDNVISCNVFHWMPLPAAPHFREIVNSSTNNFRENAETSTKCWCRTCRPITHTDMRFVVCPDCGNKRCPHANDHRNACTGSNEPGQEGSAYPAAPRQEVK